MSSETAVEAKDIVEDVLTLVEDTTDLIEEKVSWIAQNPKTVAIFAGFLGAAVGAGVCYSVLSHKLRIKYNQLADEQIADVKKHYALLTKEDTSLEEMAAKYDDEKDARDIGQQIITEHGYMKYNEVPPAVETIEEASITVTQAIFEATLPRELNVFESDMPDDYFIFEEELARRAEFPDSPHVITKEEFDQNETDNDQAILTYYDGDDVLTDTNDTPIDNTDRVVGDENLLRFGHGSGDPTVVYIRNPRLGLDFEVSHSDGKFAKEVLGFDDGNELQHSHKQPQRRFRSSDE